MHLGHIVRKPLFLVTLLVGLCGLGAGADAQAGGKKSPPSQADILFATETADLMTNTTIAALLQEIDETTPANAAAGSRSIGLIFDDSNPSMRLVGTLDPLSDDDLPRDDFEEDALDNALAGLPTTAVERIQGKWYYRRSIPLSNFAPQCAMCHAAFADLDPAEWVGALMLRVPIDSH